MKSLPHNIEQQLAGLHPVKRAWALGKAGFETAHEANFKAQREARNAATPDDPEPPDYTGANQDEFLKSIEAWEAWNNRNRDGINAATAPIVAKYPRELKALAKAAEQNMVGWAKEQIQKHYGPRFASVAPAFKAYEDGDLYGDKLEQFLTICFNCPEN